MEEADTAENTAQAEVLRGKRTRSRLDKSEVSHVEEEEEDEVPEGEGEAAERPLE